MKRKQKKLLKKRQIDSELDVGAPISDSSAAIAKKNRRSLMPKPRISATWAVAIIVVVGIIVYFSGLSGDFLQDDKPQIVNNPVIQSVGNIPHLFSGSTAYSAQVDGKLTGAYYRPLMMVFYTLIYAVFGPNPVAFHVVQLGVHILSAVILFLFLRYSFKPLLALVLVLIFLVHPIDSQSVFYIASLQEPLYFLFGILALWLLLHFSSVKSLWYVAACLFLSLLAKETGILFVVMSAFYLLLYDRKRLYAFLGLMVAPLLVFLVLRAHALGIHANPHLGQIDSLSLLGRLATAPSIMMFYLVTFVFPLQLARAYYWTYPTLSINHFVLPLLIDLMFMGLVAAAAFFVRRNLSRAYFTTFLFFALWFFLGLAMHLQVIPLDLTASTAWFYFPIVGLLGMMGVVAMAIGRGVPIRLVMVLSFVLIGVLGIRTAVRGADWVDDTTLAYHDIRVSTEDYNSEFEVARDLSSKGDFVAARTHAQRAVNLYPTSANYEALVIFV